jgi:hypothetical protein
MYRYRWKNLHKGRNEGLAYVKVLVRERVICVKQEKYVHGLTFPLPSPPPSMALRYSTKYAWHKNKTKRQHWNVRPEAFKSPR